jgi:hypothetical protein
LLLPIVDLVRVDPERLSQLGDGPVAPDAPRAIASPVKKRSRVGGGQSSSIDFAPFI